MLLAKAPLLCPVTVTKVDIAPGSQLRAFEMGLRPGAVVSVMQKGIFGGVVLDISGARLAIDRHTAKQISAETIAGAAEKPVVTAPAVTA